MAYKIRIIVHVQIKLKTILVNRIKESATRAAQLIFFLKTLFDL